MHMKRCLTSLIIREIKTTRYHLKPVRMTVIQKDTNNKSSVSKQEVSSLLCHKICLPPGWDHAHPFLFSSRIIGQYFNCSFCFWTRWIYMDQIYPPALGKKIRQNLCNKDFQGDSSPSQHLSVPFTSHRWWRL